MVAKSFDPWLIDMLIRSWSTTIQLSTHRIICTKSYSFISIYRLKFNLNSLFIGFCFHSCFAMHFIAKSKWLIFFLCVIWCRSLLSDPNSWNVNNSLITSAAWILTLFPSFFSWIFYSFFWYFLNVFFSIHEKKNCTKSQKITSSISMFFCWMFVFSVLK